MTVRSQYKMFSKTVKPSVLLLSALLTAASGLFYTATAGADENSPDAPQDTLYPDEAFPSEPIGGRQGRKWRFRIVPPQFTALFGGALSWALGAEQGYQLELSKKHVISLLGHFCFGVSGGGVLYGGGAGYGFEIQIMQGLRIELGGLLGFWFFGKPFSQEAVLRQECVDVDADGTCLEWRSIDTSEHAFAVVVLRPMLHVGAEWLFFSFGPRVAVGSGVVGGFTAGLMARF